jgi:hypothetical protein
MPRHVVKSAYPQSGFIVMAWTRSRGYQRVGPVFPDVRSARAYIVTREA